MNDKEIMRRAAEKAKKPKKTPAQILESQKRAEKVTKGPKTCPDGQIRRSAYMTSTGTAVPAKCIKDRGVAGKGLVDKNGNRVIVPLREGRLAQYGYFDVTNKSDKHRQQALRRAMKGEGDWLSLFRRLIYTSILTKNTDPDRSKIFYGDAYWLKENFAPKK